jgi:hypothetical protein
MINNDCGNVIALLVAGGRAGRGMGSLEKSLFNAVPKICF